MKKPPAPKEPDGTKTTYTGTHRTRLSPSHSKDSDRSVYEADDSYAFTVGLVARRTPPAIREWLVCQGPLIGDLSLLKTLLKVG